MNGWRTLFPNALYIAVREYRSRVIGRTFAIGTVFLAVLIFSGTQLPILIDYLQGNSQTRMEVLVNAQSVPADWRETLDLVLNGAPSASNPRPSWVITPVTGTPDRAHS